MHSAKIRKFAVCIPIIRLKSFHAMEAEPLPLPLKFAIFGNTYQARKSAAVEQVLAQLRLRGARIIIEKSYFAFLRRQLMLPLEGIRPFSGRFTADYAISVGGDGTFLKAAVRTAPLGIPLVGVNMGRLGFLADVCPEALGQCLDSIARGDCHREERALLSVTVEAGGATKEMLALNDIAILKRDSASMISISATIDGQQLVTYLADGLIVSTPTGSTAYSLSNGGPILAPGTHSILLTAVAPHSLNHRPLVISDTSRIDLDVESRSHHFLIAVDGRSQKLSEGARLTIRRAAPAAIVVRRCEGSYYLTLREKMMWGADVR